MFGISLFRRSGCCVLLLIGLLPGSMSLWSAGRQLRFANLGLDHGLSQISINTILQDRMGFMWFGTRDGLNRFDGYHFRVWKNVAGNPNSLAANWVTALAEDRSGNIWIGTAHGGVQWFDPRREQFHTLSIEEPSPDLMKTTVSALFCDRMGRVWIGTEDHGLLSYNPVGNQTTWYRHQPQNPNSLAGDRITTIYDDPSSGSKTVIWVGTRDGLTRMEPDSDTPGLLNLVQDSNRQQSLGHNHILSVFRDSRNRLWVGTVLGLYLADEVTWQFSSYPLPHQGQPDGDRITAIVEGAYDRLWVGTGNGLVLLGDTIDTYRNIPGYAGSLASDRISCITVDRSGMMWIGTVAAGLSRHRPTLFQHFMNDPKDPGSLSHNSIRSFCEDSDGRLWVGGWDGGLQRLEPNGKFRHFRHQADNSDSLGSDIAVGPIVEDSRGNLWVGHNQGLDRFEPENERFISVLRSEDSRNPRFTVDAVYETSDGVVWVAIQNYGLIYLSPDHEVQNRYRYQLDNPTGLSNNNVRQFLEDKQGRLWIATFGGGLEQFDGEQGFIHHRRADVGGLSSDRLLCLYLDNRDRLWVGSWGGGLNMMNLQTGKVRHFRESNGLPNDVVYGILPDDENHLWMSTNKGLVRMDTESNDFTHFDVHHGLQSNEFNQTAWMKGSDGSLYFGGVNGFTRFHPTDIHKESWLPPVVITDFLLANVSVGVEDPAMPALAVHETRSITLEYDQTSFGFEFAALDYAAPENTKYAYRMHGQNENWIHTDARKRFANYTSLSPGSYQFEVKGSNRDGVWNPKSRSISVHIKAPPWRNPWAYSFYGAMSVGLVVLIVMIFIRRSERHHQLEQERDKARREHMVAEQLRKVDKLKDEFLANTSHELRTPLNGIIGVAEALMDGLTGPLPQQANDNLALIVDSAKRLSGLVNDILDFSKLENHSLELHVAPVNLQQLTETVFTLSRPLIGGKPVTLINDMPLEEAVVEADKNRVQQIMYNLIGNAIKFTDRGSVTVGMEVQDAHAVISVRDTGIGIPREKWSKIFDSFEQGDGSIAKMHGGTGLGLAISRRLVALHGGRIWLESEECQGTSFYFTLPIGHDPEGAVEVERTTLNQILEVESDPEEVRQAALALQQVEGDFHILIVDDEPVNRRVLANHLAPWNYRITEVANGMEALSVLEERQFDMVLLDIMMPRMSGYEVCRNLRKNFSMYELPVILLTARNQITDLLQGFAAGANDYITKPISKYELLSRVKNHLLLLDANRHLEQKVKARTIELEQRNHEILRRQKQLIMQEKMASLGTLTAGVAHEMKNPLNFVNNFSMLSGNMLRELEEILRQEISGFAPEIKEDVEEIMEDLTTNLNSIGDHGRRADQIIQSMMDVVGGESGKRRPTDLNALVEKFTKMAWHGMKAKHINIQFTIETDYDPNVGVFELEPRGISRVVINLANNALESLAYEARTRGADYVPRLTVRTAKQDETVTIRFTDNGGGIHEDSQQQIFNPFFTTKPAGSGHIGLGLYTSYDIIVREHQGELKMTSNMGEGATFTLVLPCRLSGIMEEYKP